ncbi:MAG TPA: DUF6084 family protein [Gemmatimonadales bacterium]|nr:DUF6084 family protein [Gemmatimonadales bacterium]
MPDLSFQVDGAKVVPFALAPQLAFGLRVTNASTTEAVHTVVLRCQLQVDVTRRRYAPEEEKRLRDLFGDPDRWSQTLRTMLWTHANTVVPAFVGETTAELLVPCTFDFNVAATKYFYGLTSGDVPLTLLFSGSVFYQNAAGTLQVAPISWDKEATYRLPVQLWQDLMDAYYPNEAWLHLRRDVFDRLYRYKVSRGIPSWEQALDGILPVEEEAPV